MASIARRIFRFVRTSAPEQSHDGARNRVLRFLPRGSVGCEVGVWTGDFSARILDMVEPRELHLIDPWAFADDPGYDEAWYGGALAGSQADMDGIYENVIRRFRKPIEKGRIVVHRASSSEAVEQFPDEYFDWVYIDGNHLYEFVRADLDGFAPKVRGDGFVCGDDYGDPGWWDHGVRHAVDEFVARDGRFEAVLLDDQFLLKRL